MPLWTTLLKQAPALMAAADALLVRSTRNATAAAAANDVQAVRQRLAEIEQQQQAQATLTKQLTLQLDSLTAAAQTTAARARQALIVGGVGLAAGLVALVVALLR